MFKQNTTVVELSREEYEQIQETLEEMYIAQGHGYYNGKGQYCTPGIEYQVRQS